MDHFLSLPEEKQHRIISGALTVFGQNSYKKASVSDIASAANISKAMVFYYFGSKKALYLYLTEWCANIIMDAVSSKMDLQITDFFDRLKMVSELKVSVMKHHPSILPFIYRMINETDGEVKEELSRMRTRRAQTGWDFFLEGMDISCFKEDIDTSLLTKFLTWAAEGFASEWSLEDGPERFDAFMVDYNRCLDMMKRHFYKS